MKITLGDVTTNLPDGWTDGSIIKYADPSRPSKEGSAQPSIVITRAEDAGDELTSILASHAEQLADSLVGFEVKGKGKLRGRAGDVHYMEHRFGEAQEFAQVVLLTVASGNVYIVTGTCNDEDYPELRPRFFDAASKLGA